MAVSDLMLMGVGSPTPAGGPPGLLLLETGAPDNLLLESGTVDNLLQEM